jgi:putative hydrolase of the HAD superfamily
MDVGGVFLVPSHAMLHDGLGGFAATVTDTDVARAHYYGVHAVDRAPAGPFDFGHYVAGFVEGLGVAPGGRQDFAASLGEWWSDTPLDVWSQVLPGSVQSLRTVASHYERLAIVSNSDGNVVDRLARHRICQIGSGAGVEVLCITDSAVKGVSKPDPRVFDDAIAAVGVRADEACYVGDSVSIDVRGAQAAGMCAVHLDPHGLCNDIDDHEHLTSLAGLVELLRAA